MLEYARKNKLTTRIGMSVNGTYDPQDVKHYYAQVDRIGNLTKGIDDIVREVKELSEAIITATERTCKEMDRAPINDSPVEGYAVLLDRIGMELYDIDDPPTDKRWATLIAARNRIEQAIRERLFGAHIDIANPDGRKEHADIVRHAITRILDCNDRDFVVGARHVFATFMQEYAELADQLGIYAMYGTCAAVAKGTARASDEDTDDFDLLEGAEWACETINDLLRDLHRSTWYGHLALRYDNGREFLK